MLANLQITRTHCQCRHLLVSALLCWSAGAVDDPVPKVEKREFAKVEFEIVPATIIEGEDIEVTVSVTNGHQAQQVPVPEKIDSVHLSWFMDDFWIEGDGELMPKRRDPPLLPPPYRELAPGASIKYRFSLSDLNLWYRGLATYCWQFCGVTRKFTVVALKDVKSRRLLTIEEGLRNKGEECLEEIALDGRQFLFLVESDGKDSRRWCRGRICEFPPGSQVAAVVYDTFRIAIAVGTPRTGSLRLFKVDSGGGIKEESRFPATDPDPSLLPRYRRKPAVTDEPVPGEDGQPAHAPEDAPASTPGDKPKAE